MYWKLKFSPAIDLVLNTRVVIGASFYKKLNSQVIAKSFEDDISITGLME